MATALDLSGLGSFDPHSEPTSLATRWKDWKRRFERFLVAMDIKDDTRKRALLLYAAGNEVEKIFETLSDVGEDKDYKKAMEKLTEYFSPKKNTLYEIHKFRQLKQLPEETIDQFCTRLRQQAIICEFAANTDSEIKIQLVDKCSSSRVRRKAVREDLALPDILAYGRSLETTDKAMEKFEEDLGQSTSSVNVLLHRDSFKQTTNTKYGQARNREPRQPFNETSQDNPSHRRTGKQCYNCGDNFHAGHLNECKARGKICRACGKQNHFAAMCRSINNDNLVSKRRNEKVWAVHDHHERQISSSSDEDSYAFVISSPESANDLPTDTRETKCKMKKCQVVIEKAQVSMIVDTGATINILDKNAFHAIQKKNPTLNLKPSKQQLYAYMQLHPLPVLGKFDGLIESKHSMSLETFHVVNGYSGSLLSYSTATELGLVKMKINAVNQSLPKPRVDPTEDQARFGDENPESSIQPHHQRQPFVTKLSATHQGVFDGIGKMKDYEVHLHLKPDAKPVVQKPRKVPFHLRKQTDAKLKELEEQDIIELVPAGTPTPFVSNLVVAPKPHNPSEVRVCVDMRQVNVMIERERHVIPNIEELFEDMAGAVKFSKVDLTAGFHQLVLDEESRSLTTFHTHKGLMRYKRLCFGVNSAPEQFQHAIQQSLQGLQGVRNIADDIVVWGKSQQEHDANLEALMTRLSEKNLTLNENKCKFNQDTIWFYGYILSKDGLSADKKKIAAIVNMHEPKDVSQLRSFLGLATYCERFIQDLATITAPLRELTTKGVPWTWTDRHQHAFNQVKQQMAKDCTTAFYDPSKKTRVTVDASPVGVGAILSQFDETNNERIVAYASRTLTQVERRYSQTEKEALGVVFGCEKFHMYLIGIEFELDTDHKPLEVIYHPKSKPSARIERWALRLQQYMFKLRYRPGKTNPADVLSRNPLVTPVKSTIAEEYVNFLTDHLVPKSMNRQELEAASQKDQEIQALVTAVTTNNWSSRKTGKNTSNICYEDDLNAYYRIRNELTVTANGIVLRGNRIVIPKKLRSRTLEIAHERHQGIVKTKTLLRTKVWWPGIDRQVETLVGSCLHCQAAHKTTSVEPLRMTTMPKQPWQVVHGDFCGPFPTGEYLLVLIDEHSRFPEVEIVRSTSTTATVDKLEKIFSVHGYPIEFVSDNGPPYNGGEFHAFLEGNGIKHRKITPLWPQANGHVERFMKTLGKAVRIAHSQGKNWKKELYRFLLDYRTTPHSTTGVAPADLLFNRTIRNKLPDINSLIPDEQTREEKSPEAGCASGSVQSSTRDKALQRDQVKKTKMKHHADRRNRATESNLRIGDLVLVKQEKKNKLSLPWEPSPYRISGIKGSRITAKRRGHTLTRNSSYFKRVIPYLKQVDDPYLATSEEEEEEEYSSRADSSPEEDDNPQEDEPHRRYPRRDNRDNRPQYFAEEVH